MKKKNKKNKKLTWIIVMYTVWNDLVPIEWWSINIKG